MTYLVVYLHILQFVTVLSSKTDVSPSSGYVSGKSGDWEWLLDRCMLTETMRPASGMDEPEYVQDS